MSNAAITTITRNLSEWAGTANERFLRIDQEQQLANSLGDPRKRAQVHVAAWMLGTWHLGHGFVQVMSGNGRGFDEARIGQGLRRCSLLLRHRHHQPQRRTGASKQAFSVMQGALTALLGLALNDPGAEEFYDILLAQPDSTFGEQDHLPIFVRELLRVRAGERPNVASRLGPYEEVFRHWTGDSRLLAQHLAATLDVHLQNVRGAGSTFDDPPCRLYPAEVLAVRNVRKWLSLPTPKVEHVLMFTNLVMMPPDEPWPQHDLVQKLERSLRTR
jgi:hypothetical protein